MDNRTLHGIQGRWLQPDPAGRKAVDVTNPQSWNRYAYVLNNPLSHTDPTGLACVNGKDDGKDGATCAQVAAADAEYQKQHKASMTVTAQSAPSLRNPFIPPAPFLKPNPIFNSWRAAAAAAARIAQAAQRRTGGENASSVFKIANGVYSYTDPVTQGQKTTVDPNNTSGVPQTETVDLRNSPIPLGTSLAAESHSHPDNGGFSGEDVQRAHDMTIPYFAHPDFQGADVGLPNGNVIEYNALTGEQTAYGPGEPQ